MFALPRGLGRNGNRLARYILGMEPDGPGMREVVLQYAPPEINVCLAADSTANYRDV